MHALVLPHACAPAFVGVYAAAQVQHHNKLTNPTAHVCAHQNGTSMAPRGFCEARSTPRFSVRYVRARQRALYGAVQSDTFLGQLVGASVRAGKGGLHTRRAALQDFCPTMT